MIENAKVSISVVHNFYQKVESVKDYSHSFDKGIDCIEKILNNLVEMEKSIESDVESLQKTQEVLKIKIRDIELNLALATETNQFEDGLDFEKQRLERLNSVQSQIISHLDKLKSVSYSLSEKKKTCKILITRLEKVRNVNDKKGSCAYENLKKIEQIIATYMRIKMNYDKANNLVNELDTNKNVNVNISVNIQQNERKENSIDNMEKDTIIPISAEDVIKHGIKFDAEKHISEYDGKKFGGEYSTYKDRIGRTSRDDNPVCGYYEGIRGESKFIPSDRSVEGIVVIGILKKYGIDGIEYRNGEPDFEVCADAIVKVRNMSEHRENYIDKNGGICFGNFSQADMELAQMWNFEEKDGRTDWKPREVLEYRKANGLSWHEKSDTETMVLVKTEINAFFKHSGGCSECRLRDASDTEGGFDE